MKHILYFTKQILSLSGSILYINLIGMVLISLFEGMGIFLLIPLISLTGIINIESKEVPLASRLSSILEGLPETISLSFMLGIYVLLIIGQSFFQQRQLLLNAKIQQKYVRYLREETYKSLLQANWSFFLNNRKTDLTNLMTTEINRVSAGIHIFLQFLAALVFTMIQIGIAFWLSPKMTLFVLFFGITLIYCSRALIRKSNKLGINSIELSKTYLGGMTDHFNGIKEIKSNTLEASHIMWFRQISERMEMNVMEFVRLKTTSQFIYKIVSAILIAVFVFFSIKMFNSQPGQLMLIIIIFSRLWPRFTGIQSNLEQMGSMIPSFKVVLELQKQCLDLKEISEDDLRKAKPLVIKNGIECRGIHFRYNPTQPLYAIKNINVKIPINQMTAIVGPSGAGKSTLIDILMGLNRPEIGEVLIDSEPLMENNLLSLRRSISYVPQDPFLFTSTIRENLMIIDNEAKEQQLWEALEFASADSFVKNLPHGLDTLIGDRGIKLSGGERQRLVLARAILRKPAILVLDEATSALDSVNEAKIQASLEKLKGQMTIIVIAHRLSTIKNADQVIVLDQGSIIQQGGFSQLASEQKGVFGKLLEKQMQAVL